MADVELLVTPRAASDRVGPYVDGVLRVRVTRPPTDGDANRAVIRQVSAALGIAPRRLTLVAGERGRRKRLRVEAIDLDELAVRLSRIGAD